MKHAYNQKAYRLLLHSFHIVKVAIADEARYYCSEISTFPKIRALWKAQWNQDKNGKIMPNPKYWDSVWFSNFMRLSCTYHELRLW